MPFSGELLLDFTKGFYRGTDPYYLMNAANLNTMNSYFIPAQANIDPSNYPDLNIVNFFGQGWDLHVMSTYPGVLIVMLLILLLGYVLSKKKNGGFAVLFTSMYEGIYGFFEEILGKEKPQRMKNFVTMMFFIILLSNLLSIVNDVIRFVFPWWLRNVTAPTGEMEFNIALALVSVGVTLYAQAKHLGLWKCLHEYFPITGKGLLEGDGIGTKIGDILISMFIGLLDVVGTFAKIISLSMRLFGNMSSGSILLNVAFLGLGGIGVALIGVNLPLVIPGIVYVQGLLVACVQAFVFALLTSIFLKIATD